MPRRGSRFSAGRASNPLAARFREIEQAVRRRQDLNAPSSTTIVNNTVSAAAGATARTSRTAGDLTLNSTTWANVGLPDLVIPAAVGDWIEAALAGLWGSATTNGYLDVVSLVSAAPVNSWLMNAAPDNAHTPAEWIGVSGRFDQISGSIVRQVVAGDISGGNVTLRVRYRTAAATNKALSANANNPLIFWARNLRQP